MFPIVSDGRMATFNADQPGPYSSFLRRRRSAVLISTAIKTSATEAITQI
jgi:hypothetical protein